MLPGASPGASGESIIGGVENVNTHCTLSGFVMVAAKHRHTSYSLSFLLSERNIVGRVLHISVVVFYVLVASSVLRL